MGKDDITQTPESVETTQSVETTGTDNTQNAEGAGSGSEETITKELRSDEQPNIGEQSGSEKDTTLDIAGETTTAPTAGGDTESVEVNKVDQRKEIASKLLKDNPFKDAVYFSSDLIPFFDKRDAHKYADKLDDKELITINRE